MRFQPCREGAAGDKITMQNGPKNGAFFAVKLRTRTPAHRREAHRLRQQHSPPYQRGPRLCFCDRGAPHRAHAAKKSGAENPAQQRPRVQSTRAHSRRPRTWAANAKRGHNARRRSAAELRSVSTVNTGSRREGERPPGPLRGYPARPAPKYPRRKITAGGRAYKVPAQAAPAILRTQSAQAIQAEADKERGPQRPAIRDPAFPLPAAPQHRAGRPALLPYRPRPAALTPAPGP